MKICMHARAINLVIHSKMAKKLEANGHEIYFVTQTKEESQYIKEHNAHAKIYELDQYIMDNWEETSNDISWIADTYPEVNVWRLYHTDRFLGHYNYDEARKFINLHFYFYEVLLKETKAEIFFDEAIATFSTYVLYYVGKKSNCELVSWNLARVPGTYYFFRDIYQRNYYMRDNYKINKFTEQEKEYAREYLKKFREQKPSPDYVTKLAKNKFSPIIIAGFVKQIGKALKNKKKSKCCYMNYNFKEMMCRTSLVKWLRWKKSEKYFDQVDKNDKYYLFTLHKQPEATTLVCAENYEKQEFAVDSLAKSLPTGTVLYVKEHMLSMGERSPEFYNRLKQYANVKLIRPEENIHNMICNSLAVIVLTASTGFEALLHKKKVFILGKMYYDYAKGVEHIDDIYNEAEKFKNIDANLNDEDVERFLCSYLREIRKGYIDVRIRNGYETDENIENLVTGFEMELNRPQKRV